MSFRDLSALTSGLRVSLGVYMAVATISLWSGWQEIELLQQAANGARLSETEAAASDSRQGVVAVLYLLAFLGTSIIFLRWTYLANQNARSLGADLEFTAGWAVGWYFVPIATLWKPYQAMKEIFKASHPDFTDDWREAPRPAVMVSWWTLWIIAGFLGRAVFRSSFRTETIDALLEASWIHFASDVLDLALGLVTVALVSKLQAWQSAKHRRVTLSAT